MSSPDECAICGRSQRSVVVLLVVVMMVDVCSVRPCSNLSMWMHEDGLGRLPQLPNHNPGSPA